MQEQGGLIVSHETWATTGFGLRWPIFPFKGFLLTHSHIALGLVHLVKLHRCHENLALLRCICAAAHGRSLIEGAGSSCGVVGCERFVAMWLPSEVCCQEYHGRQPSNQPTNHTCWTVYSKWISLSISMLKYGIEVTCYIGTVAMWNCGFLHACLSHVKSMSP